MFKSQPVFASQIFTLFPPVASFDESGEYITARTHSCPVLIFRIFFPLSTSQTLAVPSKDPLATCPPSPLQHNAHTTVVCPVHFAMIFLVSTSYDFTFPSSLSLAIFSPFGDNAMNRTLFPLSYQTSPICVPLSMSHSRSEPSNEHVMMCRPPGKCTAQFTQ
ncbi:hypothetical protein BDR06DRAFT_350388 [Suillus hirtellus]|nr:hypothetical protein BDR06DRAFT_350388 [Suillus hirtellus]